MIPLAGLFVSRRTTFADFLPTPLSAVSFSIVSGIFSLDLIVCAISIIQFAFVPKFLTLEIWGISASTFDTAKDSMFGNISNNVGAILFILHQNLEQKV